MVKRKHYDQNYKKALGAEMWLAQVPRRLRSVRELPHTHSTSGKKKSRVAIEALIEKHGPIG